MNEAEKWASDLARADEEAFNKTLSRLKEVNTMNINGKWYTETELEAYVVTLENRLAQTEDKHLGECRQISEYDIEVRQLRELLHRVRSFYGEQVPWMDLFEDAYMKLTGGNV